MGTGKIYSLHVNEPQAWGQAANTRQVVVWLCSRCERTRQVTFDRKRCEVHVVDKLTRHTAA
jgi:sulfur relay (sulfurtransferase) complex TusBCD TusD component (DsrE family)